VVYQETVDRRETENSVAKLILSRSANAAESTGYPQIDRLALLEYPRAGDGRASDSIQQEEEVELEQKVEVELEQQEADYVRQVARWVARQENFVARLVLVRQVVRQAPRSR